MIRSDKESWIADMNAVMKETEATYVAHYQGLTVSAMEKLRGEIRNVGGQVKVAKNRLMRLALDKTDYADLAEHFTGATIVVHSGGSVDMAKALVKFSKENEKLKLLGGAVGSEVLSLEGVMHYATLPSLDEIRGKLVGLFQAPASQIVSIAKAPAQQFPNLFKAYADKK